MEELWNSGIEEQLSVKTLNGMLLRSLENKNDENSVEDRGLANDILEGNLKIYQGHLLF